MPMQVIKNETMRHKEAFEYYYSRGHDRSIRDTAKAFGVSEQSVMHWSTSFGWVQRVVDRDQINFKKMEKKTNESVVQTKLNYSKIVKACIAQAVDQIKNKRIIIRDIGDLEKLIKLDLLLIGAPTEITEVTGQKQPLSEMLKEMYETTELLRFRELLMVGIERKKELESAKVPVVPDNVNQN
jgi:hypothetical protein